MAGALWNSAEILAATGGEWLGTPFDVSRVVIDSRAIQQGDLFVALPGERFDGHDFVAQAAAQGATAALVQYVPEGLASAGYADFPLVVVQDSYEALVELARAARMRFGGKVVAVTGSVGKTSAKEMLKLCLSAYGSVYATSGNFNNHIGLPLTMANLPLESDIAVFEMGMNHAGEIDWLTRLGRPHVALITNVEAVHLEFFDSVREIALAKAEIINGLEPDGIAVLPRDNAYYPVLAEQAKSHRILSFGALQESDFQLMDDTPAAAGTVVSYHAKGVERQFTIGTLGAHWPKAALGILAVFDALGLPLEPAEAALAQYAEQPGRGALLTLPWINNAPTAQGAARSEGVGGSHPPASIALIDDSYNASPVSMKAALQTLARLPQPKAGRKVAILGEMRELGENTPQFHAELVPFIEKAGIQLLCTVGKAMRVLEGSVTIPHTHFDDAVAAQAFLAELHAWDMVLCKGSHGSGVYTLVESIKTISNTKGAMADAV